MRQSATAVVLLANVTAGRLTRRFGTATVIMVAAMVMAAALVGLTIVGPATPYSHIVAQLIALGSALGVIVPAMTTALLGSVDPTRSGIASGTLNTARRAGSVAGVACSARSPHPTSSAACTPLSSW